MEFLLQLLAELFVDNNAKKATTNDLNLMVEETPAQLKQEAMESVSENTEEVPNIFSVIQFH
jgi:hypothetical protein